MFQEVRSSASWDRSTLTRSIWSQEAEDLTSGNIEGEVSDGHFAAKDFAQPAGAYGKVGKSGHLHRSAESAQRSGQTQGIGRVPVTCQGMDHSALDPQQTIPISLRE